MYEILPDAVMASDAHKAVFGPASNSLHSSVGGGIDGSGEKVDIWRETRYVGGVAGISELRSISRLEHSHDTHPSGENKGTR